MGESCAYEVTDWEFLGCAIVHDPFDKYAYLKPKDLEYNYMMVESVVSRLRSPYQPWLIEIEMIERPEYKNIRSKDKCPCGSGKKYKKCCKGTKRSLTEHHKVSIFDPLANHEEVNMPFQYVSTWK